MSRSLVLVAAALALLLQEGWAKSTKWKHGNGNSEGLTRMNGGFTITLKSPTVGISRQHGCSSLQGNALTHTGTSGKTNCKWSLKANLGHQILKITVEELSIGNGDNCRKKYLRFTDTDGKESFLCGKITPADQCVYTSVGNEVSVKFVTDGHPALESFKLDIAAVDPGTAEMTCSRLFESDETLVLRELLNLLSQRETCQGTQTADTISSPNFPYSDYPSDQDCTWNINGDFYQKVALFLRELVIETQPQAFKCSADYLKISNLIGTNGQDETFCGTLFKVRLLSEGNEVNVKFHSDFSDNRRGFQLQYEFFYGDIPTGPPFTPDMTIPYPECGEYPGDSLSTARIYDGQEAAPNSWPHMVTLMQGGWHFCGGSIIAERWILTAAHCVDDLTKDAVKTVTAGEHKLSVYEESQQTVRIKSIHMHPLYSSVGVDNDIALLELALPLVFTSTIKPICLASTTPIGGTKCMATGWGATKNGAHSDTLLQVELPLWDDQACEPNVESVRTAICAAWPNGGMDTCVYDSGGPLMCKAGNVWCLVGVTNYGTGTDVVCGAPNETGVYARVSAFTDWISTTTSYAVNGFCD